MKDEKGEVYIFIMFAIVAITLIILVTISIFLIVNDINYGAKQGTIVDKRYSGPYTTYISSKIGNSTVITPQYHPEAYSMKIQKDEDGKIKECWIDISPQEYEKYNIGDYYN